MIAEKFHDCKKTFFDCRKDNRADNFEKIKIRKLIKIKKIKNKNKDKKKINCLYLFYQYSQDSIV